MRRSARVTNTIRVILMAKKNNDEQPFARKIWVSIFIIIGLLVVGTLIAAILTSGSESSDANTAIIKITGPISTESGSSVFSSGGASSTEIVRELQQARDDDNIKAVILEINSPGGSAVASDEIAQAVKAVRAENKTVVAWIREEGASGAYWVASSSDHIIANRMSITGSIGVISSYMQFDRFLARYNVSYNRLVAGNRKDIGDPFVNLTEENRRFMEAKLDRIHGFFIAEVAQNRNMSYDDVAKLADGQFFLGVEAKEAGLVDELGGKKEALAYVERRIGGKAKTVEYAPEKTFFEQIFGVFGKQRAPSVQDLAAAGAADQLRDDVPVPMLR
jgi:protease-4